MRATCALRSSLPQNIRRLLAAPPKQDESVNLTAWVKSVRAHKNVAFAAVSDGSGPTLQAVFKGQQDFNISEQLTAGSSVRLTGNLIPSRGSGQSHELRVTQSSLLGTCDPELYPIQKQHLSEQVLREHAHLRFRTESMGALMRVRDGLMRNWHDWFEETDFTYVHTPILTSSDCEGAGETFSLAPAFGARPTLPSSNGDAKPSALPFFPHPVNLTVSSQLHLEAPTHALSRTYTLSPSFRAERSDTSRHLSEFYMLEGEAVLDTLDELLDLVESGIKAVLKRMLDGDGRRQEGLRDDLIRIDAGRSDPAERSTVETTEEPHLEHRMWELRKAASEPFVRLTYSEALELLSAQHAKTPFATPPPAWGEGIPTEHEKWLATSHGCPMFVTRYPKHLKPFYMLPSTGSASDRASPEGTNEPTRETVDCFDLLVPSLGELIGGSMREHRLPELLDSVRRAGLREDDYGWYIDLRQYGTAPHGGWGMGWERFIMWVTGIPHVRDVVPFPRWAGHCKY